MKTPLIQLCGTIAIILFSNVVSAQCDPNFDFGGAAYDYYPNPDESETFVNGAINTAYADIFHFVIPGEVGDIDPLLGGLGLVLDSLTLDEIQVTQDGENIDLGDIGIAFFCNNQGTLDLDCSFLPNMQYCIALEGTAIEAGAFELVFSFEIHTTVFGLPTTFPYSLPAIDLLILGFGCVDENACNYEEFAIEDNNLCIYGGCSTIGACNYDSTAACDDGSCIFPEDFYDCDGDCLSDTDGDGICDELEIPGCYDSLACNFNPDATDDSGDCFYETEFYDCNGDCFNDADGDGVCDEFEVPGCTDEIACNYDSLATDDDGSCVLLQTFSIEGETAPVQFEEHTYTYEFNNESTYTWEATDGVLDVQGDGSVTVIWSEPGLHEICVIETDADGCSSAEVCLQVDVELFIGVESVELGKLQFYPIPATDILFIEGLETGVYSYTIYSAQGQMMRRGSVESSGLSQLNVESLSKGFYVLQVEIENSVKTIRFMK